MGLQPTNKQRVRRAPWPTRRFSRHRWLLPWAGMLITLGLAVPLPATEAPRGVLRFSEIMVNPNDLPDATGEWLELVNDGPHAAPLAGLALEVVGYGVFRLDGAADLAVPPGQHLLLARVNVDAPAAAGFAAQWERFRAVTSVALSLEPLLPNDAATLRLFRDAVLIDELSYGGPGMEVIPGVALGREPAATAHGAATWCHAAVPVVAGFSDRGTPGSANPHCDSDDDGFAEDAGDCDDTRADVSPGAPELCNGRDDDCDGDADGPSLLPEANSCRDLGVCAGTTLRCAGARGWVCDYPAGFEESETLCDGQDNDCDGETDEGVRNACGGCGRVEAVLDHCDGVDNDCDGATDEDADLFDAPPGLLCPTEGVCAGIPVRCGAGGVWECALPAAFAPPDAHGNERLCDGRDNDCDGTTDEGFGVGAPCRAGHGRCAATGVIACAAGGRGTRCDAESVPVGGVELCGDGIDNNCDGHTDEGFDELGQSCTVAAATCDLLGKWVCAADRRQLVCSAHGSATCVTDDGPGRGGCGGDTAVCPDAPAAPANLGPTCGVGPSGAPRGLGGSILLGAGLWLAFGLARRRVRRSGVMVER